LRSGELLIFVLFYILRNKSINKQLRSWRLLSSSGNGSLLLFPLV